MKFSQPKPEVWTPEGNYGYLRLTIWNGHRQALSITANDIASELAAEVHRGQLKQGDMFPSERELCARYGTGRGTVRDAMTILQGIQVADHSKGKRPRVVSPSLGNVLSGIGDAAKFFFTGSEGRAHLEQARLFLETSMLRYAIEHATNAHLARLLSATEDCEAKLSDAELFRDADVRFHRILAEIPGNPIFVALHDAFVERLMKSRPVLDDFKTRNRVSNDEHRQIVKALLDKDADKAVNVLTTHLTRNYGTYFSQTLERQMANPAS